MGDNPGYSKRKRRAREYMGCGKKVVMDCHCWDICKEHKLEGSVTLYISQVFTIQPQSCVADAVHFHTTVWIRKKKVWRLLVHVPAVSHSWGDEAN